MDNRPKVGVAILIIQDFKILLGKRKNSHGQGTWATPGGHLEFGETLEECTKRELLEETSLQAGSIKKFWFTNDIHVQEDKHYITIFMLVDKFSGELKNLEPDKCEHWQWFDLNNVPSPLFLSLENLIHKEKALEKII
jgi:8-oxo-dGTP diphosphatase